MKLDANLIDYIRLLFRKDKELYSSLYKILGFYPRNIELYQMALTHRSGDYRGKNGHQLNNERLEFLGDAVLETVISDIIYHRFQRKREGFLTGTRSKIVQRSTLNRLADDMGLMHLLHVAPQVTSYHHHLGGNAFEALMGAIYLDRGYAHCQRFVERRVLCRHLDLDAIARKEENFKSRILEWGQKHHLHIEFVLEEESWVAHNSSPLFKTSVHIEGFRAGTGQGRSKKESHQQASREALERVQRDTTFRQHLLRTKEEREVLV